MLTAVAVIVLVLFTLLTAFAVYYWASEGGFFGWYMASQSLNGLCYMLQLIGSLIVSYNQSE